ncbi:MAG TPA: superinfection immunity protein [Planktothrix sp.]
MSEPRNSKTDLQTKTVDESIAHKVKPAYEPMRSTIDWTPIRWTFFSANSQVKESIAFPFAVVLIAAIPLLLFSLSVRYPLLWMMYVYMSPAILAAARQKPNAWIIGIANMMIGWTIVGWGVCLVYALMDKAPVRPSVIPSSDE